MLTWSLGVRPCNRMRMGHVVARAKRLARWKNTESQEGWLRTPWRAGDWSVGHHTSGIHTFRLVRGGSFCFSAGDVLRNWQCKYTRAIEGSDSWDNTNKSIVSAPDPRALSHRHMIQGTLKDLPPQAGKKLFRIVTASGKWTSNHCEL
jgi:hypothetical protein